MASPLTRLHLIVRGRVQGVGYRWFVQRTASGLGLSGWARNRTDGTVEIEAEGTDRDLETLKKELESGHPYASVESIDSRTLPATGGSRTFEIRH